MDCSPCPRTCIKQIANASNIPISYSLLAATPLLGVCSIASGLRISFLFSHPHPWGSGKRYSLIETCTSCDIRTCDFEVQMDAVSLSQRGFAPGVRDLALIRAHPWTYWNGAVYQPRMLGSGCATLPRSLNGRERMLFNSTVSSA